MYNELAALIRYDGIIKKDNILITVENASVARRIYKSLKELFMIDVKIIIRIQKRFRVKTIYMLLITEKLELIKERLEKRKQKIAKKLEKNQLFQCLQNIKQWQNIKILQQVL